MKNEYLRDQIDMQTTSPETILKHLLVQKAFGFNGIQSSFSEDGHYSTWKRGENDGVMACIKGSLFNILYKRFVDKDAK